MKFDTDNVADSREQSEFNMALSWLNRLNYWFYTCDEASSNLDLHKWFQTLIILFRELSTEMKEKEIEEKQKELNDIWQLINQTQARRGSASFINVELYWSLNNFELF